MLYVRPSPLSARSARRSTWLPSTITQSLVVSSPGPVSGSSETQPITVACEAISSGPRHASAIDAMQSPRPIRRYAWSAGETGGGRTATISGGAVSITVTAWPHWLVLPLASDAVHTPILVPSANVAPDPGVQETGSPPSQLSVAAPAKLTTASPCPSLHSTTWSAGHTRAGGV